MTTSQRFVGAFRKRLELFCFFHMGSDTQINLRDDTDGLHVEIAHRRVTPFEFTVPWPQLQALAADADSFERLMLDYLTRYRRS
jgi:hypothetical protein